MSFWRTFGRIALGAGGAALAPLTGGASLAATLAAAGGGGTLAALSSRGGGGSTASSKTNLDALIKEVGDMGRTSSTSGRATMTKGLETLDPSLKYLLGILSGDPAKLTEATAPESKGILDQYDSARKSVIDLGTRGGNKGAAVTESYFQQADAMTRLLETIRPGAAKELASLGLDISKLGLGELSLGESELTSIIDALTQKRGQNLQSFTELGVGIGKILTSILMKAKT